MNKIETDIVVIGAGPGGYAAAFYAADRGYRVMLVENDAAGGVCLNRGCIPSKALLHAVHVMHAADGASQMGITFSKPNVDLFKLRSWKADVISKLTQGIEQIAKKRKVVFVKGRGFFEDSATLRVETSEGQQFVSFQKAIIAVGSKPALPAAFDLGNKRVMTSTEALELEEVPDTLLVVGGGYIGMELGTVYAGLGSKITMIESGPHLLGGADSDLVRPVVKFAKDHFEEVRVDTKVKSMSTAGKQIKVVSEKDGAEKTEVYDRVLVSIGRAANTHNLGVSNTKVKLTDRGFIEVNSQLQTADPSIFAIGDVVGGAMLAHKASKEARIAVEAIAGEGSTFENVVIPAVVFTTPEVAWCGLTEQEAKAKGISVKVSKFPWAASGRAMTLGNTQGLTKIIADPETDRVLGMGIVGANAGDMIAEGVLAIEMGATVEDVALTVHPHPTLGETIMEAAEVYYGHSSHMVST